MKILKILLVLAFIGTALWTFWPKKSVPPVVPIFKLEKLENNPLPNTLEDWPCETCKG